MEPLEDKHRILLTGSNGKLGELLQAAWRIRDTHGFDIITQSRGSDADIQWSPGQPMDGIPPCHSIISLWGRTSGSEQELQDNIKLAWASRALASHSGASQVFHISSAAIYGPGCNMPEGRTPNPMSAYGLAKLVMERQIALFRQEDPFAHVCLRLANVVGADSLAPAMLSERALHLDRFSDGKGPRRSYVAPGHLSQILVALTTCPPNDLPDALNVASSIPVCMDELASAADIPIIWRDAPETALQEVSLSTDLFASILPNFENAVTAKDMITDWQTCRAKL
ncbi:NAD dependent epimerase/dehydratase family protein [Roseovarius albus]|uniref:NAD dependent epimerase/dehydratase family protein n=1 Tax=Roseovarius albus TaxID=1247867 RepID=A0A1X6YY12_9RHOB|nr:NAD-dependent epimerase/dehydratase family protein [Roseovarius albus]SLN34646.1 NAD dependent epimerase/dehydratase family protein [Roseovarius albus]